MSSKKKQEIDFAAGRLGDVSEIELTSHGTEANRSTDYGAARLGITSDTEPEPFEEPQQDTPPPETSSDEQEAPLEAPPSEAPAREVIEETDSQEFPPQRVRLLSSPRKALLLVGPAGMAVLCGIVLMIWYLVGDDTPGPQSASAVGSSDQAGTVGTSARGSVHAGSVGSDKHPAGKSPGGAPTAPTNPRGGPTARRGKAPYGAELHKPLLKTGLAIFNRTTQLLKVRRLLETARKKRQPPKTTEVNGKNPSKQQPESQTGPQSKAVKDVPHERLSVCPSGFKLNGIICGKKSRLANINGTFVKVGDTVKGAKVIEIRESCVEMELKGQRFVVGSELAVDKAGDAKTREARPDEDRATGKE